MPDNIIKNKQIVKNTILLYIRSLFILLLNLYTSRIVLQVLGVSDYGIYSLVGGVVAMFATLGSSLNAASQRFITFSLGSGDKIRLRKIFSTCVTIHIILGLLVVILLEIIGLWFLNTKLNIPITRMSIARWVFHFSVLTFFINIIAVPYSSILIAHEKMSAYAYISILEGVLKFIVVIALKYVTWDKLFFYGMLYFIVAFIIRCVYMIYCVRNFEEARNVKYSVEKSLFKDMIAFSGWNLIGTGALVLRNQGIDVILNMFFGVTVNAAKGIANQVQGAVQLFAGNFTTSITPQLTKSVAQKDEKRMYALMFHGSRLAFFLMMLFAVPLFISIEEILEIWLGKVPPYTADMVKLIMVYLLSDTLSKFLTTAVLANGKIRDFQLLIGAIKLLALPITYVVLKLGGSPLTGLVINIILDFVCIGGKLFFTKKMLKFSTSNFVYKVILPCWTAFLIALVPAYSFYVYVSTNIILALLVSEICALILVLFFMNSREREMVLNIIRKFLK